VKHLEFEHKKNCEEVQLDAQKNMNLEKTYHNEREDDGKRDKRDLREKYNDEGTSHVLDIEDNETKMDDQLKNIKSKLEMSKRALIDNYEHKLQRLREELELRLKVEIHEIEERKNAHINDLMKNHEEAFKDMKEYYNDITRENLEHIKNHKEKLVEIRAQIEANQKMVEHLKQTMEKMERPLAKAQHDRDVLKK